MFTSINELRNRHAGYVVAVNRALRRLRKHPLTTTGPISSSSTGIHYPSYTLPNGTTARTDILPVTTFILPMGNYVDPEAIASDIVRMEKQFLTENVHCLARPSLMSVFGEYQYDEEDNALFMQVVCPDTGSNNIQALYGSRSRYYFGQDPSSINFFEVPAANGKPSEVPKFQATQCVILNGTKDVCTVFMTPAVLTMPDGTGAYVIGYGDHDTSYAVVPEDFMEANYSVLV